MLKNNGDGAASLPHGGEVFLALGSNKGDRALHLRTAVHALNGNGFLVRRVSSVYETDPVGCETGAAPFLNCVVRGSWNASPEALLDLCQTLEKESGRDPEHSHWVSRELDIDLILFGNDIIETDRLKIPHPLAHKRAFVMIPLHDIAPNVVFPNLRLSAEELLKDLIPISGIRLAQEIPPLL